MNGIRVLTAMTSALLGLSCVTKAAEPQNADDAIRILKEGPGRLPARDFLCELPQAEVVPLVVGALMRDSGFHDGGARNLAYTVLTCQRAAEREDGREQLLSGLKETSTPIQIECANALIFTPSGKRGELVDTLGQLLTQEDVSNELKTSALITMARFRSEAAPALSPIENLFTDRVLPDNLRLAAGYAILTIADAERALAVFRNANPSEEGIILLALARFGAETKGTFDYAKSDMARWEELTSAPEKPRTPRTTKEQRDEFRGMAVKGLQSIRPEIRKIALQAMFGAYGDDVYVETPEGFILNPVLESHLESIKKKDLDAEMRQIAAEALRQAREVLAAKNALRSP